MVIRFFIPATPRIRFFHPRHNGQWPPTLKDFYTRCYPLHLFSYLNSWERASIFPFQCWVLNKGTTGTIFIASLVWGGPWLGIEPGTSRTRSRHYTTRLSLSKLLEESFGVLRLLSTFNRKSKSLLLQMQTKQNPFWLALYNKRIPSDRILVTRVLPLGLEGRR